MAIKFIGKAARNPWSKHQRNKLACLVGKSNDCASEFIDEAPSRSAFISSSLSATVWLRGHTQRSRAYAVIPPSRTRTSGDKSLGESCSSLKRPNPCTFSHRAAHSPRSWFFKGRTSTPSFRHTFSFTSYEEKRLFNLETERSVK